MPKTIRRYKKSRNRKNRLRRNKSIKKNKKYKRNSKKQRGGGEWRWMQIHTEKDVIEYNFDNDFFKYREGIYKIDDLPEVMKPYLIPKINNLKQINRLIYSSKDLLGKGTVGSVYDFVYEFYDGLTKQKKCAVKIIKCYDRRFIGKEKFETKNIAPCDRRSVDSVNNSIYEINVLNKLKDINLEHMVKVYETGNLELSDKITAYYVIMDKYDYDLDKLLNEWKKKLKFSENIVLLKKILNQVAKFIKDFHNNGWVHNDIKMKNILIKTIYSEELVHEPESDTVSEGHDTVKLETSIVDYEAYVSDFDACGKWKKTTEDGKTLFVCDNVKHCEDGTYIHKRDLKNKPQDIFAFGIMLFEIFIDDKFYENDRYLLERTKTIRGRTIIGGKFPNITNMLTDLDSIDAVIEDDKNLIDLITKCLNDYFTLDDVSLKEFVEHPWFL